MSLERAKQLVAMGRPGIMRMVVPALDVGSKGCGIVDSLIRVYKVVALATKMISGLMNKVEIVKVGLQLHTAAGRVAIFVMQSLGFKVFLDLKYHDIPKTVELAAFEAGTLGVHMLSVHASGGPEMIAAARRGAKEGAEEVGKPRPLILAVTVLTSLDEGQLKAMWPGITDTLEDVVVHLGNMAIRAGADGLVCSPREVSALRQAIGPGPILMVPGTRLPQSADDDQARVSPPGIPAVEGASYFVVGRERDRREEIINDILYEARKEVGRNEKGIP